MDFLFDTSTRFISSVTGSMTRPYETMRGIVKRSNFLELWPMFFFILLYVGLASMLKIQEFRPFFLTGHFVKLVFWITVSYVFSVGSLWILGRSVGGSSRVKPLAISWGHTLIPTLVWFFVTSLLFVILPPPRTNGILGVGFSFIYLCFSGAVFLWKGILVYLVLRFGMRLTLQRIIIVLSMFLPMAAVYSVSMYRLGIFRVPFL